MVVEILGGALGEALGDGGGGRAVGGLLEAARELAGEGDGVALVVTGGASGWRAGDLAESVIEETEKVMQTESLVRKAILQGEDPQQAYLDHGMF